MVLEMSLMISLVIIYNLWMIKKLLINASQISPSFGDICQTRVRGP